MTTSTRCVAKRSTGKLVAAAILTIASICAICAAVWITLANNETAIASAEPISTERTIAASAVADVSDAPASGSAESAQIQDAIREVRTSAKDETAQQAAAAQTQATANTPSTGDSTQAVNAAVAPMAPNTIDVAGASLSYVPYFGASSAPKKGAGLWMGSDSTTDGSWGYFIGHNPGPFWMVMNLQNGDSVSVCDSNGNARTYHVVDSFNVPDTTNWEDIEGRVTVYGESVILQTCCGDHANYRIVIAT